MVILKHTPQNLYGGQIVKHIPKWQTLLSDKFILQIVRGDTIEFENNILTKHHAKNRRGKGRNPSYL